MIIQDPGRRDTFQDMAGVLQAIGVAEHKRAQRQSAESIITAIASDDDQAINKAIQDAVAARADTGGGLRGILRTIGEGVTGESPAVSAVTQTAPFVAARQARKQSQAMADYYKEGGRGAKYDPAARARDIQEMLLMRRAQYATGAGNKRLSDAEIDEALKSDPTYDKMSKALDKYMDEIAGATAPAATPRPAWQVPKSSVPAGTQVSGQIGVSERRAPGAVRAPAQPAAPAAPAQPQTVVVGQEIVGPDGKKYRVTGVDADGTAIGEEIP